MLPYWFSKRAIFAYVLALTAVQIAFVSSHLPVLWIVFGLAEVAGFFWFSSHLTRRWADLPPRALGRNLFRSALFIRVIYVVAIYYFYLAMTGEPFEFDAADSKGYHGEALWILDLFASGDFGDYFETYRQGFSDSGHPLWLALVYSFTFRSIMAARLIGAVLSAWTVVLTWRLARRNFGDEAGLIAGVFALLLPTFIFYCGLHTKETVMVFFLAAFAERADDLLRRPHVAISKVAVVVFLGLTLFFFRTVLAVAAWFALFSALVFSSERVIGGSRRFAYAAWFLVAALYLFSGRILTEVEFYWNYSTGNQADRLEHMATREEANRYANYGTAVIFAPLVVVGPLPAMVETGQPNAMMINGANFARNAWAYFVLLGLVLLWKRRALKRHVLVLAALFAYLAILALSGFALSERFHMPALPFLLALAGYGVASSDRRNARYFVPWLVAIVTLTIAWNWFKLAGRGMI